MTDQFKFNAQQLALTNNSSNFNNSNIFFNNSQQPLYNNSQNNHELQMMDEDYSENEYELSPKDDVPSPSKKRGRGPIQNGIRRSPNKWTKEENQKLFQLVSIYGEKKWKRISAEMGGQKTGAQCAQHWKRVLSPDIRKGPWDEDEEELLLRLVNQHGSCWKKIAKRICKRTDIQCRYQYLKALQSREVLWVPKEDEILIKKVQEMAENLSWLEVSEYLAKLKHTNTLRTALECKTRYHQLTDKLLISAVNNNSASNNSSIALITSSAPGILASSGNGSDSGSSSPPLYEIDQERLKSNLNSSSLRIHTLTNNSNNNINSLVSFGGNSSSSSSTTTSPVSSPVSSPSQSPCTIKSNNNHSNNNLTQIPNHNNNNNSNSLCGILKSGLINALSTTLPPLKSLPNIKNSGSFAINNILDQKDCDLEEDDIEDQPKMKKIKSGEFYFQPINNNNQQQTNSDTSSDDDMFSPKKKLLTFDNNNNNNNIKNNINILSPIASWDIYKPNNSHNNNNSKILDTSSPSSSPNLPIIQKLKSDFFNLESLAALATLSSSLSS